jgi:hypothetical protein
VIRRTSPEISKPAPVPPQDSIDAVALLDTC